MVSCSSYILRPSYLASYLCSYNYMAYMEIVVRMTTYEFLLRLIAEKDREIVNLRGKFKRPNHQRARTIAYQQELILKASGLTHMHDSVYQENVRLRKQVYLLEQANTGLQATLKTWNDKFYDYHLDYSRYPLQP